MHFLKCETIFEKKESGPPQVEIVANSGGSMDMGPDGRWVVDLSGQITTRSGGQIVPILYSHDWDEQLGHTQSFAVDGSKIVMRGVADGATKRAKQWAESSLTGFPWNASLGFVVMDSLDIPEGETIAVNGREEAGPLKVATSIEIWEVSVCTFGADKDTSAKVISPPQTPGETLETDELKGAKMEENKELKTADALDAVRLSRASIPTPQAQTRIDRANVATAAILKAAGVKFNDARFTPAELEAADALRCSDFRGIVEGATGWTPSAYERGDGRAWLQAAISTQGLSGVLSKCGDALLLEALGNYERRWAPFFKISAVNDFRKSPRFRIDSTFAFQEVQEGEGLPHGYQEAYTWELQAKTYGRQYTLSYQSIVNGEAVGAYADIMQQVAYGAEEALNRVCWGLVMNPGKAVDGQDFYGSSHKNTLSETDPTPTASTLQKAIQAFTVRSKKGGESVAVTPKFLVVPPALEFAARTLVSSSSLNNGSADYTGTYNPFENLFNVISAPQLQFSEMTGNSDSSWYLFADPAQCAAFEIGFLHGQQAPTVRSNDYEIGRLGLNIDGFISFGAIAEDWRGAFKVSKS